jgi:hypothetical protein
MAAFDPQLPSANRREVESLVNARWRFLSGGKRNAEINAAMLPTSAATAVSNSEIVPVGMAHHRIADGTCQPRA